METHDFFYQAQAVKYSVFKVCMQMLTVRCTTVFLSCHLLHRVRVVYIVKALDTLFAQGLRGDIMSIEAQAFSSTPGNNEHLKNENR